MQRYHCTNCASEVFFQNDHCLSCGKSLGFDPTSLEVLAFDLMESGLFTPLPWNSGRLFRRCENGHGHAVCNWMIPAEEQNLFCISCRLNEIVPDLTKPENVERWRKIELAKRRCIYSLLRFRLPLDGLNNDPGPLRFQFLSDAPGATTITTGHQKGCITMNVLEADELERERLRVQLHEPYRTLVGHFRHELGHFYWERVIKSSPALQTFRDLFGDEREDYASAMRDYYQQGPAKDWQLFHITAYASAHPWEDWAETWAHYFHIVHTKSIADSYGLMTESAESPRSEDGFADLCEQWIKLSCAFNAVNRGMGLNDVYPFFLTRPVVEKLRFVNQVVGNA